MNSSMAARADVRASRTGMTQQYPVSVITARTIPASPAWPHVGAVFCGGQDELSGEGEGCAVWSPLAVISVLASCCYRSEGKGVPGYEDAQPMVAYYSATG